MNKTTDIDLDEEAFRMASIICGYIPPPADLVKSVRLGLGKKPTVGFKYSDEAAEIVNILRAKYKRDERRSRVRAVGEKLCKLGGFQAMQDVAMEIRYQFPYGEGDEDGWHPGIIDYDWDGICGWRT